MEIYLFFVVTVTIALAKNETKVSRIANGWFVAADCRP